VGANIQLYYDTGAAKEDANEAKSNDKTNICSTLKLTFIREKS
jgi:hypothetical protein